MACGFSAAGQLVACLLPKKMEDDLPLVVYIGEIRQVFVVELSWVRPGVLGFLEQLCVRSEKCV